ncbi:MAG: phage tail tape measure protein [Lachnospiraceae bacterium]|nr:phage tail tape measure protein [Lachnospiraceae bacterium]
MKLEEAARSAGETTKFSATEAAEAMSYMGLAGWSADEMCEGLSGILNLAAVTEYDESLVRKLIEKITVYDDHFTVEFKSGLETEVTM